MCRPGIHQTVYVTSGYVSAGKVARVPMMSIRLRILQVFISFFTPFDVLERLCFLRLDYSVCKQHKDTLKHYMPSF